jgi:tryptophan-rich sensory protein
MRDPHLYPALAPRSLAYLVLALFPSMIASVLGSLMTAPALGGWYLTLAKPFFTPPNIVFPLVWTFLYALMALAFWRILRARPEAGPRAKAIVIYLVHILFNVGWSYAFFAQRSPYLGLVVVAALFISIVLTIRAFRVIDRPAAFALFPYLAWVGFAAILNGAIAVMNPG